MKFTASPLKGCYLIDLEPREDCRGFFARYFCKNEFLAKNLNTQWVQINNSMSRQIGTLRGLHLQRPPNAEVKLVRCLRGAVWDVVVDLRENSGTFGRWFGATLSEENRTMMYVPKGFAHGFITLKTDAEILYLVSECYSPKSEDALLWSDPAVGIQWPMLPNHISEKDEKASYLAELKPVKI
jgi:dTDP-4-dehydrorhamnose 3,5-epimerase